MNDYLKIAIGIVITFAFFHAQQGLENRVTELSKLSIANSKAVLQFHKDGAPDNVQFSIPDVHKDEHADAFSVEWTEMSYDQFREEHPESHFIHMHFTDADVMVNWDLADVRYKDPR